MKLSDAEWELIGKISPGRGTRGAIDYVLAQRQPAQPEAQPAPDVWEQAIAEEVREVAWIPVKRTDQFLAGVRARLAAKPPQDTREQQVTAILQETVKETNKLWVAAAEIIARVREGK